MKQAQRDFSDADIERWNLKRVSDELWRIVAQLSNAATFELCVQVAIFTSPGAMYAFGRTPRLDEAQGIFLD